MGIYYRQSDCNALKRSIYSILHQTVTNFELLVCDDGSSKQAVAFLNQIANEDKRVKLIRPGRLRFLPHKLNACLAIAKGQYIARMDDDDFSYADRFARQIKFLDENQTVSFVGSWANLFQLGTITGTLCFPKNPCIKDFYMTQPFLHPSLMFRKKDLIAAGGYSEEERCILCEDYDLLLRLYAMGYKGANIQEPLLDYTITNKKKRFMKHRWNEVRTRWHGFKRLGVLPRAFPYVVKPLVCGIIPDFLLKKIKDLVRIGRLTNDFNNCSSHF